MREFTSAGDLLKLTQPLGELDSCQHPTPLLGQDQPWQDEGHGGPPGAHRLRAARLVRGRRHDPHVQHVETCARRLEMGCETN